MPVFKDITGARFGHLTAIRCVQRRPTKWLFQCDCGNEAVVMSISVTTGKTKSCGCLRRRPSANSRDLAGQQYGRLTVLERDKSNSNSKWLARWLCRCECGIKKTVLASSLTSGKTRSCGCLHKEITAQIGKSTRKHGAWASREYRRFMNARHRTRSKRANEFRSYGSRGIQFLFTSFEQFFAELGECPPGFTLGRINNNGHYEPGNVKWERPRPQQNNTRANRKLVAFGRTENLATWARMLNIDPTTLSSRMERMSVEKALSRVRIPRGTFWMLETVPASETYSQTDSWEWRPYAPPPMTDREVEIAYAIEAH